MNIKSLSHRNIKIQWHLISFRHLAPCGLRPENFYFENAADNILQPANDVDLSPGSGHMTPSQTAQQMLYTWKLAMAKKKSTTNSNNRHTAHYPTATTATEEGMEQRKKRDRGREQRDWKRDGWPDATYEGTNAKCDL